MQRVAFFKSCFEEQENPAPKCLQDIHQKQELEHDKFANLLIKGRVRVASHFTIGKILAEYHTGYKKTYLINILKRY